MFPRSNRPGLISQQATSNEQLVQPPASSAREPETKENQSVPSTPDPNRVRQYGYYENTHWYCNCKPATTAVFRHVKKDGRNQGRCFWGCRDIEKGCGFFLWLEEAEERQAAYVPNSDPPTKKSNQESIRKYLEIRPTNDDSSQPPETPTRRPPGERETRVSPVPGNVVGELEGDVEEEPQLVERPSTPPPRAIQPQPEMPRTPGTAPPPATPHSKRRRDEALEDDDYLSELSPEEEREFAALADSATRRSNMSPPPRPTTPTPVRTRTVASFPTPQTNHRNANPSASTGSLAAKRQRVLGASSTTASSSSSSSGLQAPPRFNIPTTPPGNTDDDLSVNDATEIADLMALLQTHNSPPEVCEAVRTTLNRFASRTATAITGRALARTGLEGSQEKIMALQKRVIELENTLVNLRGGLLSLIQDS